MADGRAAAARRNGKLGGRPRLFLNGTRPVAGKIPEDDARLLELLAVREDTTVSKLVATACWQLLASEGLTPTWGVPDADRASIEPVTTSGSPLLHEGDETGTRPRSPGWGACQG